MMTSGDLASFQIIPSTPGMVIQIQRGYGHSEMPPILLLAVNSETIQKMMLE